MVTPHAHEHHCPFLSGDAHAYCPPQPGDSRSPCPALNTLANHGFLPRDGKCIRPKDIVHALRAGYALSHPLAWFLTYGGYFLLGQRRDRICLADLARHACIEHDASLVHPDVHHRDEYAPLRPCPDMLAALLAVSADGALFTPDDVARARVRREADYPAPLDPLHAEIARGEMAIVIELFNNPDPARAPPPAPSPPPGLVARLLALLARVLPFSPAAAAAPPLPGVPLPALRTFLHDERLPDAWAPYHETTLLAVVRTSARIRTAMKKLQAQRAQVPARVEEAQVDAPVDANVQVSADKDHPGEEDLPDLTPSSPSAASDAGTPLVTPTGTLFGPPPSGDLRKRKMFAEEIERIAPVERIAPGVRIVA